jgi:hypothetical protein
MQPIERWSWRFRPTPDRSWTTSISWSARWSAGPTPERMSNWGGVDGPATDDHLLARPHLESLAVLLVLDAGGLVVVEQDPRDVGAGLGLEGRAVQGRLEVAVRRAVARALQLADREDADPIPALAVEVVVVLEAGRLGGLEPGCPQLRWVRAMDVHWPVPAVGGRRPVLVRLEALEDREDVVPGPALVALRGPRLVVFGVPPDVDHRVDRTRSTDGLPSRPVQLPVLEFGLRDGRVVPVGLGLEQLRGGRGDGYLALVVRAARLEDEDVGVHGQPVGHHAARRPRAHHQGVHRRLGPCRGASTHPTNTKLSAGVNGRRSASVSTGQCGSTGPSMRWRAGSKPSAS